MAKQQNESNLEMLKKISIEEMTAEQREKYGTFNMPLMKLEMDWIDRKRALGDSDNLIKEALMFVQ